MDHHLIRFYWIQIGKVGLNLVLYCGAVIFLTHLPEKKPYGYPNGVLQFKHLDWLASSSGIYLILFGLLHVYIFPLAMVTMLLHHCEVRVRAGYNLFVQALVLVLCEGVETQPNLNQKN